MYNYLESTQYLCEAQLGFRLHRSCTTQLILVADILSKRIEERLDTDIVYIDKKNTFDKVPHMRLLTKLRAAGIQGSIYDFIYDFLSDRKYRINVNGSLSSKSPVKSGVPQGSILGPLLFILFRNDLPSIIVNHCMMFADDTKLFGNPGLNLQLDVETTFQWAQTWQMNFDIAKCKIMHFGTSQDNNYDYYMTEHNIRASIAYTTNEKDIGVTFDTNLCFNTHITTTVRICCVIKRSFTYI